jgi:serine protease AprX
MTISFGWSLDFSGSRRAVIALLVAFATAIFGQAAFTAGARAAVAYDPGTDQNSMNAIINAIGAQQWWTNGYTGQGVDVALIDTGCAPVQGLNSPGKLVYGPDLSLESQAPNLAGLDTNGHGTFMASILAGNDAGSGASNPNPYTFRGVAPDARVVCVKVATADGGTDVSQVIAAIDWVVQHAHDNGLNIRIINLSYGTNSTQSSTVDPLAFAAEQAWKRGIVVVAAAGNSGYQKGKGAPGLADPAYDPYLIAVGATQRGSSGNGPGNGPDKETMANFSASGAGCGGCRNPDVVAPGAHVQGLRVPGSFVDESTPPGLLDARFQRGSGTSESTAIVSGAVALLLQKYPSLTPDQVKKFLTTSTVKIAGADDKAQGKGRINLAGLTDKKPDTGGGAAQHFPDATGTGSLEIARGADHLTRDGVVLRGEIDIFGHPFDAAGMAALEASASAWNGGTWNGNVWTGNSWSGNSWSGNSWSGNSWSGNSWSGNSWSGNSWSGNSWSGNSWSGNSWSGNSWSGNSWSGNSWSSDSWM